MVKLDTIKTIALANEDRAFALLGHRPGPGYDIVITPTRPVSASWRLEGRSEAGKAWLNKLHGTMIAKDNTELNNIKQALKEWGLTFYTDWSCVKVVRSDP